MLRHRVCIHIRSALAAAQRGSADARQLERVLMPLLYPVLQLSPQVGPNDHIRGGTMASVESSCRSQRASPLQSRPPRARRGADPIGVWASITHLKALCNLWCTQAVVAVGVIRKACDFCAECTCRKF